MFSAFFPSSFPSSSLSPFYLRMDQGGVDSQGKRYASRLTMWEEEAGETSCCVPDPQKKQEWYSKGIQYWEGVEASVEGVLGGYGIVNKRDITGSNEFLTEVLDIKSMPKPLVALDCGAGVGRVSKNLLLHRFHEVDLVEPVTHFLDTAKQDLKNLNSASRLGNSINFYGVPLQEFTPVPDRYNVIWVQWCIGHLTDQDLIAFFKRTKVGLKRNGLFVVKENVAEKGFVVDKVDSSVTRSDALFRDLFEQAGLYLYKSKLQKGFPKKLFGVRMYALTTEPITANSLAHQTRSRKLSNQPAIIS